MDQSALQDVFKSLAEAVGAVGAMAEGKRTSAFNNLKVVAEASQALFWVASDAALGDPNLLHPFYLSPGRNNG